MTDHPSLDPKAPIRLADIIPIAFPLGGMTVSGLRKEAGKGRLTIMRMAGKDFTTLADIEEMKRKCRESANRRGSGSGQEMQPDPQHGSSLITESNTALASALALANKLKNASRSTSQTDSSKSRKPNIGQLRM